MSASVNKVILIGNLGREPEIRTFQNGDKICTINIATSERWKDKSTGERREKTEWHTVQIHTDSTIRFVEQYTHKGSKVYIEGQLETRKWTDAAGTDRYTTNVVLRPYKSTLALLDGRQPDQSNTPETTNDDRRDLDDEIPF